MATIRRIEDVLIKLHLNKEQEKVRKYFEALVSHPKDAKKNRPSAFLRKTRDVVSDLSNTRESIHCLISELGEKTYRIQSELNRMYQVIEDSEYILYLSDDYDSNGSLKPSVISYHNAILFLVSFANLLYTKKELYLNAPSISAARDGSIDLSWRTEDLDVGMLINFSTSGYENQYYCYREKRTHQRKGFLSEPFDELNGDNEELFFWMKNNLTKFWA